ncbi:MAG: LysE family translocator [Alphaproteobacteria bacterium]
MLDLLPPLPTFLAFLVAGLALNITPGADMTFVAVSAGRGGWRGGLAAAAGVTLGCFAHIAFAAVGLSALIAASATAFAIVKYAGVAYLLFLAVQLARQKDNAKVESPPAPPTPWDALRRAALVNVLNPKVGIFFLAFLPQFVVPGPNLGLKIAALGLVFNATGFLVNAAVALAVALTARRLAAKWLPRAARLFAASVMGALAMRLALTSRH